MRRRMGRRGRGEGEGVRRRTGRRREGGGGGRRREGSFIPIYFHSPKYLSVTMATILQFYITTHTRFYRSGYVVLLPLWRTHQWRRASNRSW